MTTLFYLFTVPFIIYELHWLYNPIQATSRLTTVEKEIKAKAKWELYSDSTKNYVLSVGLFMELCLVWLLIGLASVNWPIFLGFILWSSLVSLLKKGFDNLYYKVVLNFLNTVVGLAFALFLLINHFHLHINVGNNVIEYLK